MKYSRLIGLDFETYGAKDLPTYGLHNYVGDSTFTPLIASTCWLQGDRSSRVYHRRRRDFHVNFNRSVYDLAEELDGRMIVAHNAPFEQMVLRAIGIDVPSDQFIDSAVLARALGAAGKLEAAAPQLLNVDKMEDGRRLINLFSKPGKYQEENDCGAFDPRVIEDNVKDWLTFGDYCDLDAQLGLDIALLALEELGPLDDELVNQTITMDMNNVGWPVDVPTVEEMQRRYLENQEQALADFRAKHNAIDLNLNSLKQMKEWCEARGIKAKSFDEKNVTKMIGRITDKLRDANVGIVTMSDERYQNYSEVLDLLLTKQTLGGSSLKKLQVILDTTGKDCRLRDQYLHVGAGQTWRTTGRSVQMQNLKRLAEPADMLELQDLDSEWDNDKLAHNLRQVFTSSHPQGNLIVGDFSSVEGRGLAWLADEGWKLSAYRHGQDLYKVAAAKQFGVDYYDVTKAQRQFGKVGELSCGYQAGGGAVQSFAEGMGVTLTEGEANQLVIDWRAANPKIVELWNNLDEMLRQVVENGNPLMGLRVGPTGAGFRLQLFRAKTPDSLLVLHPNAQSVGMRLLNLDGRTVLTRYFHGCYVRGRSICYYKPTERKTGDVWVNHYTDPKTKQVKFYSIYGGKLAGILTQSFCREIFFITLRKMAAWVGPTQNLTIVGQFHDEIVLDWTPPTSTAAGSGQVTLDGAMIGMKTTMSDCPEFPGFPLEADIKHDYRYTK